jgi:hypothetical protein
MISAAITKAPSQAGGSVWPTCPSALAHYSGIWALTNLLLFLLPFVVGTAILKLCPSIFNNTNTNDLALGLPLIAFYASVYTIFIGTFNLLEFKLVVCIFLRFQHISTLQISSDTT